MIQKPRIGIMPVYDSKENVWWMLHSYMTSVEQAGGIPFMFPQTTDEDVIASLLAISDGVLFTGGQDIEPAMYGQQRKPYCGEILPDLDKMESIVFPSALKLGKPILATCRGAQLINVLYGGTLYQDLAEEHPSDLIHEQKPPYNKPVHSVNVKPGSLLHKIVGGETLQVNSFHHQAVANLSDQLSIAAESPDGLTEAFYLAEHPFLLALQWHPEWMIEEDEISRKIFRAFIDAC